MTPAHKRKSRRQMLKNVARLRFFWLLLTLIGCILVAPSIPLSKGGQIEMTGMIIGIFFAAAYVSQGVGQMRFMAVLAVLLVMSGRFIMVYPDARTPMLVMLSCLIVTLGYASVCVLSFVLDDGEVGTEHIYGAICAYVFLAMAFATIYLMLEIAEPGSFSGVKALHNADRPWWQFFYFSFSTLSTVGYGDIVPQTMRARSFVIVEQLMAVFYVAIIIARLTGMYSTVTDKGSDSE